LAGRSRFYVLQSYKDDQEFAKRLWSCERAAHIVKKRFDFGSWHYAALQNENHFILFSSYGDLRRFGSGFI